ncbi:hypothetical protein SAMN05192566_1544 [Methylophilus rhizosphaerae]|uniref:Uncharacterized protein n=1 Tax=Methylophilus rhizosphaerae TaxID=492660 RepID=A0A1G9CN71_9PROT|nr:hypothetical protein [Methylophilus rhizosphaerae]SDK53088.1 hypothetical protein SAMN05192566_1544 [Methylophilus rhizosphaerae]
MLVRYRWYNIRLPKEMVSLSEVLLQRPYTNEGNSGFAILNRDAEKSPFRFYWKTKVVVTSFDLDGNVSYSDILNVNYVDFSVIDIRGNLFIRVDNPGRNIKDLLNAIESIVGLGFISEPVSFTNFEPMKVFVDADSIKLIGLKVSDVVIAEDLISRMEFSSKQGIDPNALVVLQGSKYKVDTGTYEITYESAMGQISVSAGGLVKINGQLAPKLLHQVEDYLLSSKTDNINR